MKRILIGFMMLIASLVIACGDQGGNKPANNAPANNSAAKPADPAASQAEIKKLMDTAQAALAKNDADAMEKIYADDYMLVNLDGSVQTKAERLASLRSGEAKYESFSYSDANIRISPGGDDAVAIAKLTMKGTFKGKPTDGDYRVTQVYTKTKDGWKQMSAQATKIEGGAAKTDDKTKAANTKPAPADKAPAPVPPANK
jgi:uncharacterized protein (TIGR02246 family)